jgi:serine/threonine protein phosphatase PrpC
LQTDCSSPEDPTASGAVLREVNTDVNVIHPPSPKLTNRRRLSVAEVDGTGITDSGDNRGLIRELDLKTLIELVPQQRGRKHGRRFSIGSHTDHDMHRRASYCDKSILSHGHPFDSTEHGVGFACKKGLKPVSPNQDSFLVLRIEGQLSMYGVFDGHGRLGHDVSNFVKDVLPKLIVQDDAFKSGDIKTALLNGFARTQELLQQETNEKRMDASASGTTCSVVIHRNDRLWVASVGDSRCVIASRCPSTGSLKAKEASRDHKPDLPDEMARIIHEGGVVVKPPMDVNHRVYVKGFRFPGLAMSRALGDLIGHHRAGISATPEVNEFSLSGDEHLILCSDGVWEFLSSQDAVDLVSEELLDSESHRQMEAAEKLCKVSWDKWIEEEHGAVVDDITAIVAKLSKDWDLEAVSGSTRRNSSAGTSPGLCEEYGVMTRSRRQSRVRREKGETE